MPNEFALDERSRAERTNPKSYRTNSRWTNGVVPSERILSRTERIRAERASPCQASESVPTSECGRSDDAGERFRGRTNPRRSLGCGSGIMLSVDCHKTSIIVTSNEYTHTNYEVQYIRCLINRELRRDDELWISRIYLR